MKLNDVLWDKATVRRASVNDGFFTDTPDIPAAWDYGRKCAINGPVADWQVACNRVETAAIPGDEMAGWAGDP